MLKNLYDIFAIIDKLYIYLADKKILINKNGLPVFTKDMFLDEWPEMVIPFSQRKNRRVNNKKKTVLCFFDSDYKLYPRLERVFDELDEYSEYMGVIGMDITITDDMDEEWQQAISLLNQLFMAVLAVNGIKVLANTRVGGLDERVILQSIPKGIMVASGFLGCSTIKKEYDFSYLKKIMFLRPERLLLYGKHDVIVEKQLDDMGINYRVYKDFHRLCKEEKYGR